MHLLLFTDKVNEHFSPTSIIMYSDQTLFTPLTLPCRKVLPNRIVKAAMEENMSGADLLPDHNLFSLYRYWAHGGLGAIITGNVMVDKTAMTGPGGVVLDETSPIEPFKNWAKIIRSGGALAIMQINHPGRQVFKAVNEHAIAPSAVNLKLGRYTKQFAQAHAATCEQIYTIIRQFVTTALRAREAGFDGVEIHAAHGYLLSQFLSPLVNQRTDQWGGSLANRARLLINIVSEVRAKCGNDFSVWVKLNAADFQRGGMSQDEAREVVAHLNKLGVDVVEISGGSYEMPAMQGRVEDSQTLQSEAYFAQFAAEIAKVAGMPVMTTGGISRLPVARQVTESGCDLVGMASALATTPDLVKKWQENPEYRGVMLTSSLSDKTLASLITMSMVRRQLRRLGNDLSPLRQPSQLWSLILDAVHRAKMTRRYRALINRNS